EVEEVQKDRIESTVALARAAGAIAVLIDQQWYR
ncbi:unnamed protein product, partial [marine sediment metagenome]